MTQGHSKGSKGRTKQPEHSKESELWKKNFDEAIRLWRDYAEIYRTAPLEYKFLVTERRKAHIYPINTVSKAVLNAYPRIELLYCIDEFSAREYLSELSTFGLIAVVKSITDMVELDHSYRSIMNKIKEFRYWARHCDIKREYCYNLYDYNGRNCCNTNASHPENP